MSRYAALPQRAKSALVEFDYYTEPLRLTHLEVDGHESIDTGLVTINGDAIMRLPNPIGFGKDDEW